MKIGPKYKIARRLGDRVFPKCQTTKFTVSGTEKKTKSKKGRRGLSEYGSQLLEKQKARFTYCVSEKQFSSYIKEARDQADNPAVAAFISLEKRLDNIVFRLGLAPSRLAARQMVSHGHIYVNGRRLNIPSHQVKIGDKISVRPQSKTKGLYTEIEEKIAANHLPTWLKLDEKNLVGELLAEPKTDELETNLNFVVILEFYSRS
ncbi:MAG: 30S ribosomal protein S4 [Patescibacteria group bacterium]